MVTSVRVPSMLTYSNRFIGFWTISVPNEFVTPEEFGARGDGDADDGAAFLAALESGKRVLGRAGSVYAMARVFIRVATHIDMRGATLKLLPGEYSGTGAILEWKAGSSGSYIGGFVDGNRANQSGMRQSGIRLCSDAGPVVVRDVICRRCLQHGIFVESAFATVENITGEGMGRDVVSLDGAYQPRVRNIRGKKSTERGTVEIADGTVGAVVEGIYGERQEYVVDFQDHLRAKHRNLNNTIRGVRGRRVKYFVRATAHPGIEHVNLLIDDVQGSAADVGAVAPVEARYTRGVTITHVRIDGLPTAAVHVDNASDVRLVDVGAVEIVDCINVTHDVLQAGAARTAAQRSVVSGTRPRRAGWIARGLRNWRR